MPSVLMNGPLGPSSNSQPSNAASGLAMRVRGWVNNPASVIVRPLARVTSARAPPSATTASRSIVTPRRSSLDICSASGSKTPLRKKVVAPQSGNIRAWWMASGEAASTPIGPPSSS